MSDTGKLSSPKKGIDVRKLRPFVEMIIRILNNMKVVPSSTGEFILCENNLVLKLKAPQIPDPPSSGTYILTSIDGTIQWVEAATC